jgi:hypothetical protein
MRNSLIYIIIITLILSATVANAFDAPEFFGIPEADAILKTSNFKDISTHWSKQDILKCAALSIMNGISDSAFRPDDKLTREQALAVLVRLMGLDAEARQATLPPAANLPYSDWAHGYIMTALNHQWTNAAEMVSIVWDENATRQEVASWAAKALGLLPIYTQSDRIVAGFKDGGDITPERLPYIAAIINEEIMAGTSPETFSPESEITRGQMAAIACRILPKVYGARGFATMEITILGASSRQTQQGSETVYRAKAIDGSLYDIVTSEINGVLVLNNGVLNGANALTPGVQAVLIFDTQRRVMFAEITDSVKTAPGGTIKSIDYSKLALTVEGYDGKTAVYSIDPQARVHIAGETASFADLQVGQHVELISSAGRVVQIQGSFEGMPGALPAGERMVAGIIRALDDRNGVLTVTGISGETYEFSLKSYTRYSLNGMSTAEGSLSPGESVSVYTDSPFSNTALRVEAHRIKQQVTTVLKGRIERVMPRTGELVLSSVSRDFYGSWIEDVPQRDISLVPGAPVYTGGVRVALEELAKFHLGDYIYLAVSSGYGRDEAIKAVVQQGDETCDNGEVTEVDRLTSEAEVGERFIAFDESSIVVRDGLMIDSDLIPEGSHIFFTANEAGSELKVAASRIDDPYPTGFEFYKGELDEVLRDGFSLRRYSFFDKHEWTEKRSRRSTADFRMGLDPCVIDVAMTGSKLVDVRDFLDDRNYHEYYGREVYTVVKDERVLGVSLWTERPGPENTSLGVVETVNKRTGAVILTPFKDWSGFREKWDHRTSSLEIFMDSAIIIKDGDVIEVDDLNPNDVLYLIRDNNIGIIAVVQRG